LWRVRKERKRTVDIEIPDVPVMDDEMREEVKEIARLKLQKERLKLAREVKELKDTVSPSASPMAADLVKALLTKPEALKAWTELTDEQRATIIATVQALTRGGKGLEAYAMLPVIMSMAKSGYGAREIVDTAKGMIETAKAIQPSTQLTANDIIKIVEAVRKGEPEKGMYETYIKPLLDEVKTLREELAKERIARLEKEIAELKSRPGFTEELARKKEELMMLRDLLGLKEGVSVDLEKARLELEKWKAEKEWEWRKWQAEQALREKAEERKAKTIMNLLKPFIQRAGPMVDELTGAVRRRFGARSGATARSVFICPNCNTEIPLKPPYPEKLTCPNCKQVFERTG